MIDFRGSVALVTGANKGLGLEIARQLGQKGIKVVLGSRDLKNGESAADKLRKEGIDARGVKLDVTRSADVEVLAAFFQKNFGRLDILVNNAGINAEPDSWNSSTASKVTLEQLRKTFETNVFGAVGVTQAVLALIKTSPHGRIVNQSSILGSIGLHADPASPIYPVKPLAYDASKAALNMFTTHLAAELAGSKVKVNSAHPGWVKTDMGTDAAPMVVEDGAKTAVWLATLNEDGPNGGFFHMKERLPW